MLTMVSTKYEATVSPFWLVISVSQATSPHPLSARRLLRAQVSLTLILIAGFYRLHEAQLVEAVIAEHRTVVRIDEQSGRRRYQKITVRDPAAEQGIARRFGLAHVRVKIVAAQRRELLDVRHRHFAFG